MKKKSYATDTCLKCGKTKTKEAKSCYDCYLKSFNKRKNRKVFVKISYKCHTYIQDVTKEQQEYWNEISTNGANKHLERKTFKWWTRPLKKFKIVEKNRYNTLNDNAHFIFGVLDSLYQSDDVANWMIGAGDKLLVEVYDE